MTVTQRYVERLPQIEAIQITAENLDDIQEQFHLTVVKYPSTEDNIRVYFQGNIGDHMRSARLHDWVVRYTYAPHHNNSNDVHFVANDVFQRTYVLAKQAPAELVLAMTSPAVTSNE